VSEPVGDVARRKLEENGGRAENGLQPHDVGERHADLVLPEESDDRDRKERGAEPGGSNQKRGISIKG
jgi:hypothetical protein